ncbi:MAG: hypothetical protein M1828_007159 [Chrysothrix sp. TS-e1954]|nr:MAG: hypothetical protein M1828_007159 [Chrysothrix sp. TS-e1954]
MQSRFFSLSLGDWPDAIDWTGAVMGTYVTASLRTLSRTANYSVHDHTLAQPHSAAQQVLPLPWADQEDDARSSELRSMPPQLLEDTINRHFSQITSYYFGQNAVSLRGQAFDDILWVVLGWLESVKLMDEHNRLHHQPRKSQNPVSQQRGCERPIRDTPTLGATDSYDDVQTAWFATQYSTPHAHRSHVFHALASRGWNETICGGGLTWNPRLAPYKNSITNQLFIAASVGMYLYHPGDSDRSPFSTPHKDTDLRRIPSYHRLFLDQAIKAYDWLLKVNLTNSRGLYVDGYHISHRARQHPELGPAQCDLRNEMVYTYNQGVILSALRGLWEATGNITYLEHGHSLMRSVMRETGWHPRTQSDHGTPQDAESPRRRRGMLGTHGILTESCDPRGTCSQDAQTFKGIFMHHLTLFCEPLPLRSRAPGKTHAATREEAAMHRGSCRGEYAEWVVWNARAALRTLGRVGRGGKGGEKGKEEKAEVFGAWWGAGLRSSLDQDQDGNADEMRLPRDAVDVRNDPSLLRSPPWSLDEANRSNDAPSAAARAPTVISTDNPPSERCDPNARGRSRTAEIDDVEGERRDPNARGRGRTVETQGGGLMLLRAAWELSVGYRYDVDFP